MKRKLFIALLVLSMPILAACNKEEITADITEADVMEAENGAELVFEDGRYALDTNLSVLYWEAWKVVGGHMGAVLLKDGELIVTDGKPNQGSFRINMKSITNADLDEDMQAGLLNHLASDDFFAVASYPEARFEITKILPHEGEGDFNYEVRGDLSIRDATSEVTVLAKIEADGNKIKAKGRAMVNRTDYGINFRSGKFFEGLGDSLIKDEFQLELDLVAERSEI